MSDRDFSPLRYPGGKSKISPFIEDIILLNNLEDSTFYELYAGGSGAALNILFNGVCKNIVLNDFDPHIYQFWYSILNITDDFIHLIDTTTIDIINWNQQKEIYNNHQKYSELEVGFSTFFLNRCNRSGILQAGPIGGHGQNGNYSIDVRFNKLSLIGRIERIAEKRDQIQIFNKESISFISELLTEPDQKKFFFLDPPYYVQGENLYFNFYKHEDHVKLSRLLQKRHDLNWFLTYDNCSEIGALYKESNKAFLPMTYTLQEKKKAKEIMVFANALYIPQNLRIGKKNIEMTLIN